MKNSFIVMFTLWCIPVACDQQDGPSLEVNDMRILAPLPGSKVAIAYFSVLNHTDEDFQLLKVSSPQYDQIEMHETNDAEGVARMRPVAAVAVPANGMAEFAPGGLHVMLMKPLSDLGPGSHVTMQLQLDANLLIVTAELRERRPAN